MSEEDVLRMPKIGPNFEGSRGLSSVESLRKRSGPEWSDLVVLVHKNLRRTITDIIFEE
jgi:hypothetical protein